MAAPITPLDDCDTRVVHPDTVDSVRASLPSADRIDGLGAIFGLLADPGRIRLLASLSLAGELCVCDLAAASGMRESTVSHALRLLRAHRVVAVRRQGRRAYYRLQDGHVRTLLETGLQHADEVPGDLSTSELATAAPRPAPPSARPTAARQ